MKENKIIITGLLILVLCSSLACLYAADELLTYEDNGVIFTYPTDWQRAKPTAQGSIVAIALTEDPLVNILIQQVPSDYGNSLSDAYTNNNKNLTAMPGYTKIQETTTTVNDRQAIVHRYMGIDQNGLVKEHVATWMTMSDNKNYVILFSTPAELYEKERGAYDQVVASFELIADKPDSLIDSITELFKDITGGS